MKKYATDLNMGAPRETIRIRWGLEVDVKFREISLLNLEGYRILNLTSKVVANLQFDNVLILRDCDIGENSSANGKSLELARANRIIKLRDRSCHISLRRTPFSFPIFAYHRNASRLVFPRRKFFQLRQSAISRFDIAREWKIKWKR